MSLRSYVVGASLLLAGVGCISSFISMGAEADRERQEKARVSARCQEVMDRFDSDRNGRIGSDEGVAMARALGVSEIFPTNYLVFQLNASDHYSSERNYATLRVSSLGNDISSQTYGVNIVDVSVTGKPVFDTFYPVSRNALEQAARGE